MAHDDIQLRPCRDEDERFLFEVHASTRVEELAALDPAQREQFLEMQHLAQHTYYHQRFPDCEFLVIERSGVPMGRLYLDRRQDELRIVDIALLDEFRGHGVGSYLLRRILDEAEMAGLPVRIHVEKNNPARTLYDRLGFRETDDTGAHYLMEWSPGSRPA